MTDLSFSFALVGGRTETQAESHQVPWLEFVHLFVKVTPNPSGVGLSAYKSLDRERQQKEKETEGWMPVTLREGGTRRREDVVAINALVLDSDEGTPIDDLRRKLSGSE